jgi:hypothetical protein
VLKLKRGEILKASDEMVISSWNSDLSRRPHAGHHLSVLVMASSIAVARRFNVSQQRALFGQAVLMATVVSLLKYVITHNMSSVGCVSIEHLNPLLMGLIVAMGLIFANTVTNVTEKAQEVYTCELGPLKALDADLAPMSPVSLFQGHSIGVLRVLASMTTALLFIATYRNDATQLLVMMAVISMAWSMANLAAMLRRYQAHLQHWKYTFELPFHAQHCGE